jgi:hypothetical protein
MHSPGVGRGRPAGSGRAVLSPRRSSRSRRGQLKEQIIQLIQAAGKKGIHVKEIVEKTGAKDPNVRVWFYSTGKKIKNIKQVAPATYGWFN